MAKPSTAPAAPPRRRWWWPFGRIRKISLAPPKEQDRLDRCLTAYGVLLMLILLWAITQVPWEDKKPTIEDEAEMHEWFCKEPNQDSGPCVHFRMRKEHGPQADAMRKALLQTKAYAKARSEMFEGWCIGERRLYEGSTSCHMWRYRNLQREGYGLHEGLREEL